MTYREAVAGSSRELVLPYMPSASSERALYASSMAMPFGGFLTLAAGVNPILAVVGAPILGLGGLIYYRCRPAKVRFVLDDVALEVVWPAGAPHGSAARLRRDEVGSAWITRGTNDRFETEPGFDLVLGQPTAALVRSAGVQHRLRTKPVAVPSASVTSRGR